MVECFLEALLSALIPSPSSSSHQRNSFHRVGGDDVRVHHRLAGLAPHRDDLLLQEDLSGWGRSFTGERVSAVSVPLVSPSSRHSVLSLVSCVSGPVLRFSLSLCNLSRLRFSTLIISLCVISCFSSSWLILLLKVSIELSS